MTILLTNDDGIDAPGLAALAGMLVEFGPVLVAAPAEEKSGAGQAITIRDSIRIEKDREFPNRLETMAVHGTPADAVKFALWHRLEEPPDLVVSGPNTGQNIGANVRYSGTLGAAFEAATSGISAVAVSSEVQDRPPGSWDWTGCIRFAREVVGRALGWEAERRARPHEELRRHPEPPFVLNLNVPALPPDEIRGLRITRHGQSGFREFFVPHGAAEDSRYRIDGEFHAHDPDETYDAAALAAGYASLTPLTLDMTDHARLEWLEGRWGEDRA
jgi:5'-nucleotidase